MNNQSFSQKLKLLAMTPVMAVAQIMARLGFAQTLMRNFIRQTGDNDRWAKEFNHYKPTKHDVFAATFLKSGTNWSMQITQQIAWLGQAEFEHIHDVVAWPDTKLPFIVPLTDMTAQQNAPTGLRIIKTHLPASHIPYHQDATYITVLRDPKEVIISAYHFFSSVIGIKPYLPFADWYDLVTTDKTFIQRWAQHTATFWAWRDRPNVLILTFNEMKQDMAGCIQKIATQMGVSLTESQFAEVVERSSFPYMKKHDTKFAPPRLPFTGNKRATMMRSGKAGASSESLTPDQQATIDRLAQAELQELGSNFPYAKLFKVVQ